MGSGVGDVVSVIATALQNDPPDPNYQSVFVPQTIDAAALPSATAGSNLAPVAWTTLNALDQAALVLQLRELGNTKADLITTAGRGFRPPGTRNPHSWTIVDEPQLALWVFKCLQL